MTRIILYAAFALVTFNPFALAGQLLSQESDRKQVTACVLAMGEANRRVAKIADPSRTQEARNQLEGAQNMMDQREQGCMRHIDNATRTLNKDD